ncbi:alpha-amylase family glycosyl hydrolase [Sphingomonas sp. CFBP 13720]|uniref:alpha-amylase family glycosyl hydrolase n=1 Tax=Sphingomonas sp. CFBP 13720 TaxID=2775302 RepID=UPI00177DA989|nr:alpha-amylase family glycosyl hydrolase [Sphingomonas sp. CFBP 13720]MBD8677017.1 alpha-amylase [Sphingomonas sp. CFBP 13720]
MIRPLFLALLAATPAIAQDFRQRAPEDEVIYFVLPDRFENGSTANDRGGIAGDRMRHGFDPTAKGFYHGGDLKGLTARLPYIKSLGATAIWVGPIFRNKAVQGGPGQESAGYHGYWVTDFTHVDPHLGTDAEFKALVDAAHAAGMKVYMDIIANHTADVIRYRECAGTRECVYRSRADYPYAAGGKNAGFVGDRVQTADNFAKLTDPSFAYTPEVPPAERSVKVPAWLNDPIYYHNRGNTTFANESSQMGDFVGLDDLMTEHPRVVAGMIDIFGGWIDRFGIDGYRIDTARHVNPEFWAAFVPAMQARALAKGIPNFHIFGEVALSSLDAGGLAAWTKTGSFPAVLDFSFREAVLQTVAGTKGTDAFETVFDGDVLYAGGEAMARQLPTFTGNHDNGRFAYFVRKAFPQAGDGEILSRVMLGNAMLLTLRGVPTIYSGDEQGFAGDGNDQDAREDMFASKVASYNDNRLVGTTATTATTNFTPGHPLYRQIADLAKIRTATPALTRGRQLLRAREEKPGLLAISRFHPGSGQEVLLLFNTSPQPVVRNVEVETRSTRFRTLAGRCSPAAVVPGQVRVDLPAFGYAVCAAETQ